MNLIEIKRFREIYITHLLDEAETLQKAQMPALSEEKFALFETTGNRLEYEHDYFERRKFLTVSGCAVLLGKERYLDKLCDVIGSVCDEECWALPAHVNRKEDPNWRMTVDLFASETAHTLSELYGRLNGVLPEELLKRMRSEVMRRVLIPFDSKQPFAWWETSEMNWNAVCDGSIGMAALMMLDDEPEMQTRILKRVLDNLDYFLDGFSDDGACLEGLSYFTYGFGYYMGFMDLMARKAKDNEVLFCLLREHGSDTGKAGRGCVTAYTMVLPDKCRKIAEFQQKCYLPSGLSVSFSDGSKHEKYRIGLTCRLAELYDTVEIPDIASAADFDFDPCYRFLMVSRDLMWSEEYFKASERNNAGDTETCPNDPDRIEQGNKTDIFGKLHSYLLPLAQWSICHGASGGGFAVKGGHNAEPHNHNDVGSFIYSIGDEPLLTDLGAGEYTAQYFRGETRYEYICCSSLGHNVPVINGRGQQAGREFACDNFTGEKLSFAGAYGEPALRSLDRSVDYDPVNECLSVEDVFDSDGCLIEENLVTQGAVEIENEKICIKSDHSCRIVSGNGFPELKITEEPFMNHEGKPETVKRITWKVADETQTGKISCKMKIEPVR